MSAAAFRKGRHYQIYIPTLNGGLVQRSTGTADRVVVRGMVRMVRALKDGHRWTLLAALTAKAGAAVRLSLKHCYAAYLADPTLRALEGQLTTPDVVPLIPAWLHWLDASLGVRASGPRQEYELAVRSFTGPSRRASEITPASVRRWLATMPGSTGYRRAAYYRLRSFVRFLVEQGTLRENPLRDLTAPAKGRARIRYENEAADLRIVQACPDAALRALFALIHGTGADVSSALTMRRRDIQTGSWTCHIPGTKTHRRDRHDVAIDPWARPFLSAHIGPFLGDALLWPDVSRHMAHHHHAAAAKVVRIEDYTLRDARHSVAVRMIRAGATLEEVSRRLGTSLYLVGTVYGEFRSPRADQRVEASNER